MFFNIFEYIVNDVLPSLKKVRISFWPYVELQRTINNNLYPTIAIALLVADVQTYRG